MELKEEQKRVVFHDEGDLLVSASAGSGKTFTVIRRLIRLIVEGKARVGEILAVTFTEKAAAEMKAKLQNALAEAIAAGNTGLKEQFGEVYTADICTVHAFCGRLLRKYFFEAGLSPDSEEGKEICAMHRRWLQGTDPKLTPAKHKGIAELYVLDERFTAYYDRQQSGCARFLRDAVARWAE